MNDSKDLTYLLVSAFVDGNDIVPVKITVMSYKESSVNEKIHMIITLPEIENAGIIDDISQLNGTVSTPPATIVSLSDFLGKIKMKIEGLRGVFCVGAGRQNAENDNNVWQKRRNKMKALFIGGTGTISMAITEQLAKNEDWDLYLLNRGNRSGEVPEGVHQIVVDINDEAAVAEILKDQYFDVVGEFIGFETDQIERDIRLFKGKTGQYIYISSASAYDKPCKDYRITEGTTLANKYWQYSRNKIACEELLMKEYRENGFPVTIVRPSHTYDVRNVPMGVHGKKGSYQVIKRMMEGKPIIVHGDGTSLWTMTFNEDFAKGYIGLMANRHAIGEAFQITCDETLTWNQIFETIADALGVEYKPYYVASSFLAEVSDYDLYGGLLGDKSNSVVFDNTKLKKAVPGFAPCIRFEQGIKKTLDYIKDHPECQVLDPEFDDWCDRVINALEEAKKKI